MNDLYRYLPLIPDSLIGSFAADNKVFADFHPVALQGDFVVFNSANRAGSVGVPVIRVGLGSGHNVLTLDPA